MSKTSKETSFDSELLRRLYVFFRPYRYWALLALILTLTASFLGTLGPKLTQIAVDDYIFTGDKEGLLFIILLLMAALIGEFVVLIANTYITRWFGQGALFSLRNAVFRKIQSLHVQFFDNNPIGRLITRTTSDIEALSSLLSDGVINMIGDLFRIVFILSFMLAMSWELTIISILVLPVLFYSTFWFKNKVRVAFLNVRDQVSRLNSFIQEHIAGMAVIQLFNREKREGETFRSLNADHRDAHVQTIFYFSIFWPIVEVLASFAMALVVWYGGARVLSGGVTFGVLLAFIHYVRQFFAPIRGLSEKYNTLQSALASSERIFQILDQENPIQDRPGVGLVTHSGDKDYSMGTGTYSSSEASDPNGSLIHPKRKQLQPGIRKEGSGHIRFKNVWFRYREDQEWILKDVSFEVMPGELAAIVGATGSGKTTIINLLMRFYDIQRGEILLDDRPLHTYSLDELRSHFGLVLQDHTLFSGTILQNITLGHPGIREERVREAAMEVEAYDFISRLPGALNYPLAERGGSLSMGQKQLICFVRAMVYEPDILILDEATSNVDSETEHLVSRACEKMMKDRTSLVIAHRLSTIRNADKILVMHKGQIRETGTHDELVKQPEGIYRKLVEYQYKDQLLDSA